jgi:hypothetical protein
MLAMSVFLVSESMAQDKYLAGYYVTNNVDTVRGYIEYRANYKSGVKFRPELRGPVQKLEIENIKSFGFNSGRVYSRVTNPLDQKNSGQQIFIRPIVDGEIDLYSYRGKMIIGSEEKGQFALAKKGSNSTEAMKNLQKNTGVFNILFQECPTVKNEAQNVQIGEENLVKLIESYHNCRGISYNHINTKAGKRMFDMGIFVGQRMSSLSFTGGDENNSVTYLGNTNFNTSSLPTFGIVSLVGGKSPSSVLSFQSGISYSQGKHSGTSTFKTEDFGGYDITQVSTTHLNYSVLSLSAGLRMTMRSNKINPYLAGGASIQRLLSLDEGTHQTTTINTSIEEEEFSLGIDERTTGSLWATVGVKKRVGKGMGVFAECNIDFMTLVTSKTNATNINANIKGTSIRVGFLF